MKYHYYSREGAGTSDPGVRSELALAGPVVDDRQVLSWFTDLFPDFQADGVVIDVEGHCRPGLGEYASSLYNDAILARCHG